MNALRCPKCTRPFPSSEMQRHVANCEQETRERNFPICPDCGNAVRRCIWDKHRLECDGLGGAKPEVVGEASGTKEAAVALWTALAEQMSVYPPEPACTEPENLALATAEFVEGGIETTAAA